MIQFSNCDGLSGMQFFVYHLPGPEGDAETKGEEKC